MRRMHQTGRKEPSVMSVATAEFVVTIAELYLVCGTVPGVFTVVQFHARGAGDAPAKRRRYVNGASFLKVASTHR
jgi:hypothetical protein